MKNLRLSAFAIILAVSASAPAADVIIRHSTTTPVRGEIKTQTTTEVVIAAGLAKREAKVPANDIAAIDWDGQPAEVRLHRNAEEAGRLAEAAKGYQEAIDKLEPTAKNMKADLEFGIARATAKMAVANPEKLDEAIQKLELFKTTYPTNFRYYDCLKLLGDSYVAKNEFTKAEPLYNLIEQSPWKDYKMAAQVAKGRLLLRRNDVAAALTMLQSVAGGPATTDAEKARKYEAMLGVATCHQRQNNPAEADKILDQVIKQASPEDAKTMGEAYLRKGDMLLAQGKKKDALMAYLHVDILFSARKDIHAEALYRLATLWNEVAKPERAADARNKLATDYPNSEWSTKLSGGSE